MEINEIRERTKVYDHRELRSRPLFWIRGEVLRVVDQAPLKGFGGAIANAYKELGKKPPADHRDVDGLLIVDPVALSADDLPVEFFSHQLMEYDPFNEEAAAQFVRDWGIPFSPMRNDKNCLELLKLDIEKPDQSKWIGLKMLLKMGIKDTELLISKGHGYSPGNAVLDIAPLAGNNFPDAASRIVSLLEVQGTLAVLQTMWQFLQEAIKVNHWEDETLEGFLDVLHTGASNPICITPRKVRPIFRNEPTTSNKQLRHRGNLTSAICNQVIDTLADSECWKECAARGCDRLFKYQQSKSERHNARTIYCSGTCANRQKKWNQRHRG